MCLTYDFIHYKFFIICKIFEFWDRKKLIEIFHFSDLYTQKFGLFYSVVDNISKYRYFDIFL